MHERVYRSSRSAAAIVIAATLALPASAGAAPGASLPLALEAQLAADAPAATPAPAKPAKKEKKAKAPKAPKVKQPPHVHTPDMGPWDTGANWVTVRAGYNRATYRTAADGNVGWGFGATHMINTGWSISALVERNVLGKFGDAAESEIPFTLELSRHLKWGATFRPYYGFGGGTYYHKFAKTTQDLSEVRGGGFLAGGGNIAVSPRNLLGIDARLAFVSSLKQKPPDDPVFGPQKDSSARFSIKAGWSVTY